MLRNVKKNLKWKRCKQPKVLDGLTWLSDASTTIRNVYIASNDRNRYNECLAIKKAHIF